MNLQHRALKRGRRGRSQLVALWSCTTLASCGTPDPSPAATDGSSTGDASTAEPTSDPGSSSATTTAPTSTSTGDTATTGPTTATSTGSESSDTTGPAGCTKNVVLMGYWPPTNEMLRPWSTNATQNPDGWIGKNWGDHGYDVHAFFPEFPPDGDPNNEKIEVKNIPSGFGNIGLTYDIANSRFTGNLQLDKTMGPLSIAGTANLLVDPGGWYFLAGGKVQSPVFLICPITSPRLRRVS